jgi:seryl-tRNA synthetase
MLSLQFIRDNPDAVARALQAKNVTLDLSRLRELDAAVRAGKTEVDELRRQRNEISAGFKSAPPEERAALGARAKEMGARAAEVERVLAERQGELDAMMLRLPGIPWEGAPVGPDESFNIVVRQEGAVPKFDFEPRDHVALLEMNDWAELGRITQVSGLAHLLPERAPRDARAGADALGAAAPGGGRLHADDRPRHRPPTGIRRHRPFPGP